MAAPRPTAADLLGRLATHVRRRRAAQGLTVEAVAAAAGLDSRHIERIESGRFDATLDTLARAARGLGVTDPADLIAPLPKR